MALEPAGISLQAEGFNDYFKKLQKIEKEQREVFDAQYKGTGQSYAQVVKAAKAYELELENIAKAEAAAVKEAEKAAKKREKIIEKEIKAAKELREARKASVIKGGAAAGGAVLTGVGGITAAVGAAAAAVTNLSLQTDQATRQISASLGISAVEAANRYTDAIQQIRIDNPQAGFDEIAESIALTQKAMDSLSPKGVRDIADSALKVNKIFGEDTSAFILAVEQQVEKMGSSGEEAVDLITKSLQTIPADDVLGTFNEYTGQFADIGFSGEQMAAILNAGATGIILGTDKAADAVKEFQIRFVEGNDDLKKSFANLGLSYDQFRSDVDTGQATIGDAFFAVTEKAKDLDLSVISNRKTINALGTQFEDLDTVAIAALANAQKGFGGVEGAADALNIPFESLDQALLSLREAFLVSLIPIGDAILDVANDIIPKLKAAFETAKPQIEAFANAAAPLIKVFAQRLIPVFQVAQDALGRIGEALGLTSQNVDGASNAINVFEKVLNGIVTIAQAGAIALEGIARALTTLQQAFAFAKAGIAAFGSIVSDVFGLLIGNAGALGSAFLKLVQFDFEGAVEESSKFKIPDFTEIMDNAGKKAIDAFKGAIESEPIEPIEIPIEVGDAGDIDIDKTGVDEVTDAFDAQTDAIELTVEEIEAYEAAIKQAEDLQRSWAREAEDAAIKVARASEDAARKQAQAVADLQGKQAGDRDKLLKNQSKKLDEFERDRKSQIKKAENDIRRARQEAAEQRKRDQQKLQRELAQAQEKFNLSQLQSERRFKLQESRLIAEGDILGLKQLREDQALQRQEEKENFDQSQKERVQSAAETEKGQVQDLEKQLSDLKENLEDKRAELLRSFDQEIADQAAAQAEERQQQLQKFQRDDQDRAIALQREEEDRRLSQARQLEDLGRSWAEQGIITEEGAMAIAGELEKVFGIDGAADEIMAGFADKTKNDFTNMIDDIQAAIANIKPPKIEPPKIPQPEMEDGPSDLPPVIPDRAGGRIPRFQEGGIVPGSPGSPQLIVAHAGETIIPAGRQQSSFTMAAPVIPSQSLEVNMSGGFNVSGDGQGDEKILRAAAMEMTENFRIAVQRLARRN